MQISDQQLGPGEAVRERLLSSALELFNRKGYAATTVREIVKNVGVSKPVLYYYFKSKEGLYLELLTSSFAVFDAIVAEIATFQGSAQARIIHCCEEIFDVFVANLPVARLSYSIYFGLPQGAPHFNFDAFFDKMIESFDHIVEEGIERQELKADNPRDIAWTIISVLNQTMEEQLCHNPPRTTRKDLHKFLNLVFEGITA